MLILILLHKSKKEHHLRYAHRRFVSWVSVMGFLGRPNVQPPTSSTSLAICDTAPVKLKHFHR